MLCLQVTRHCWLRRLSAKVAAWCVLHWRQETMRYGHN